MEMEKERDNSEKRPMKHAGSSACVHTHAARTQLGAEARIQVRKRKTQEAGRERESRTIASWEGYKLDSIGSTTNQTCAEESERQKRSQHVGERERERERERDRR